MNRKNSGSGKPANLSAAIQWSKVDPQEYAGGLLRPGFAGDAGYDMCASRTVTVPPDGFARIPTNIRVAVPAGYWSQIIGRSSTFFNKQLLVQQAVIDNGYRGELWCVVRNMSSIPVVVQKRERIAQLILYKLVTPECMEVQELPPGDRGEAGFGSTDQKAE